MLAWVNLALGVLVAALLLAGCGKRYRSNVRAMLGGILGALGLTCLFSLILAGLTGFLSGPLIPTGAFLAGVAALGGFLYAEARRVRGLKGSPPIAEDLRIEP
jgi:uncharacterized membrane protein YkvI